MHPDPGSSLWRKFHIPRMLQPTWEPWGLDHLMCPSSRLRMNTLVNGPRSTPVPSRACSKVRRLKQWTATARRMQRLVVHTLTRRQASWSQLSVRPSRQDAPDTQRSAGKPRHAQSLTLIDEDVNVEISRQRLSHLCRLHGQYLRHDTPHAGDRVGIAGKIVQAAIGLMIRVEYSLPRVDFLAAPPKSPRCPNNVCFLRFCAANQFCNGRNGTTAKHAKHGHNNRQQGVMPVQ